MLLGYTAYRVSGTAYSLTPQFGSPEKQLLDQISSCPVSILNLLTWRDWPGHMAMSCASLLAMDNFSVIH
jgi:hypothetical protein